MDPATGPKRLHTSEPELLNTAKHESFHIAELELFDAAGPKLASTAFADFFEISHFEKIDSQLHIAKISWSSIFATNIRLSNSQ